MNKDFKVTKEGVLLRESNNQVSKVQIYGDVYKVLSQENKLKALDKIIKEEKENVRCYGHMKKEALESGAGGLLLSALLEPISIFMMVAIYSKTDFFAFPLLIADLLRTKVATEEFWEDYPRMKKKVRISALRVLLAEKMLEQEQKYFEEMIGSSTSQPYASATYDLNTIYDLKSKEEYEEFSHSLYLETRKPFACKRKNNITESEIRKVTTSILEQEQQKVKKYNN